MNAAVIAASLLLGVAGQVLFKMGMSRGVPYAQAIVSAPVLLGLLAYGLSTLFWLRALARLPLAVAYPYLSLNFILVPLAGHLLLREPVTPWQVAGSALIVIGVLTLAR